MNLKVLIISDDIIGIKMAGPGIRAWEMSKELSKYFELGLMVPDYSDIAGNNSNFSINKYSEKNQEALINKAQEYDVLIVQGYILNKFKEINKLNKIIVVDLYVPFILENMFNHMFRLKEKDISFIFQNDLKIYKQQLKRGNLFLVANQHQLNLIVGGLLLLGKINPKLILKEKTLCENILEIPFGFKEKKINEKKWVLKEKIGFNKDDFILLWGGVITNWFDPITLIEAMSLIKEKYSNIKLLFLSTKHANPFLPEFDMAKLAENKAKRMNLYNKTVFFNHEWVPYEERWKYFGAADVGISMHKIHIETQYSFRTRFLDYLNFELPIVSTEGDYLSESLSEKGALIKVKENDVTGLVNVLINLYKNKSLYNNVKKSIKREKNKYKWENVLKPLVKRLKNIEGKFDDNLFDNTFEQANREIRIKYFLKKIFPFIKKFEYTKIFIKMRRYFGK